MWTPLFLPLLVLFAACEQTTVSVLPSGEPAAPGGPNSPGGSGSPEGTESSDEPPSGDPGDPDGPTLQMVHPDWPVTLPDGAVIMEMEVKSDRLKYQLQTGLDYADVYDRLHTDIVADGWERDDLDRKKEKVEAEYERRDLELEVKVERDGGDGVKVDLELDD